MAEGGGKGKIRTPNHLNWSISYLFALFRCDAAPSLSTYRKKVPKIYKYNAAAHVMSRHAMQVMTKIILVN